MQKEYNCVLIQLQKVVQLNHIVFDTEHKIYLFINNGKDIDKSIFYNREAQQLIVLSNKKINQLLPHKTPYYDGNGHLRLWNTGNIFGTDSKEIVCAYPKIENTPSLPLDFIKQYVKAGCPNKIYLKERLSGAGETCKIEMLKNITHWCDPFDNNN